MPCPCLSVLLVSTYIITSNYSTGFAPVNRSAVLWARRKPQGTRWPALRFCKSCRRRRGPRAPVGRAGALARLIAAYFAEISAQGLKGLGSMGLHAPMRLQGLERWPGRPRARFDYPLKNALINKGAGGRPRAPLGRAPAPLGRRPGWRAGHGRARLGALPAVVRGWARLCGWTAWTIAGPARTSRARSSTSPAWGSSCPSASAGERRPTVSPSVPGGRRPRGAAAIPLL